MILHIDAIDLLKHDHRIVEQMFLDYEVARSDAQRRGVVEILIRELSKHAALEELTVYPFARQFLPDQAADVDHQLAEHMAVKKILAALDRLPKGAEEEERLVAELRREVTEHVADEEGEFMPALRGAVDQQALDELGDQLGKAKKMAPTRPHPDIPDQPPGEVFLGALAAIYDRFRDRLQRRPIT
jgi:hemerythrin superfamily protein